MTAHDTTEYAAPIGAASLAASTSSGGLERRAMVRWAALLALGLQALPLYAALLQVAESFLAAPGTLFWPLLGATMLYAGACYVTLHAHPAASHQARWREPGLILALGQAARAIFFGMQPLMSPDAYRYVWDAHLLAHGISPYTTTPFDDALQPLRDQAIWPNVRYRHDDLPARRADALSGDLCH